MAGIDIGEDRLGCCEVNAVCGGGHENRQASPSVLTRGAIGGKQHYLLVICQCRGHDHGWLIHPVIGKCYSHAHVGRLNSLGSASICGRICERPASHNN
jgi:hypothetical protein